MLAKFVFFRNICMYILYLYKYISTQMYKKGSRKKRATIWFRGGTGDEEQRSQIGKHPQLEGALTADCALSIRFSPSLTVLQSARVFLALSLSISPIPFATDLSNTTGRKKNYLTLLVCLILCQSSFRFIHFISLQHLISASFNQTRNSVWR